MILIDLSIFVKHFYMLFILSFMFIVTPNIETPLNYVDFRDSGAIA